MASFCDVGSRRRNKQMGDRLIVKCSNTISLDFRPDAIEIGDFNNDGLLDIRVLSYTSGEEFVLIDVQSEL